MTEQWKQSIDEFYKTHPCEAAKIILFTTNRGFAIQTAIRNGESVTRKEYEEYQEFILKTLYCLPRPDCDLIVYRGITTRTDGLEHRTFPYYASFDAKIAQTYAVGSIPLQRILIPKDSPVGYSRYLDQIILPGGKMQRLGKSYLDPVSKKIVCDMKWIQ